MGLATQPRTRTYLHIYTHLFTLLQKSRKIFDPADHDQPARKRSKLHSSGSPPPPSLSSSVQNGGGDDAESEATAADTSMSPPVLTADGGGGSGDAKSKSYVGGDVCNQCMEAKNKLGRKEPLVSCRDCSLKGTIYARITVAFRTQYGVHLYLYRSAPQLSGIL